MSDQQTWLSAASEFRKIKRMLKYSRANGWTAGKYMGPLETPDVCEAIYFVWGGSWEYPLHDDLNIGTSGDGRKCPERAARICESLAYDGTDGP